METYSLVEAKTNLSRLVDQAALGSPFAIAKHGRTLVVVTAAAGPATAPQRLGFMREQLAGFEPPQDFDTMMAEEIERLFEGPAE